MPGHLAYLGLDALRGVRADAVIVRGMRIADLPHWHGGQLAKVTSRSPPRATACGDWQADAGGLQRGQCAAIQCPRWVTAVVSSGVSGMGPGEPPRLAVISFWSKSATTWMSALISGGAVSRS